MFTFNNNNSKKTPSYALPQIRYLAQTLIKPYIKDIFMTVPASNLITLYKNQEHLIFSQCLVFEAHYQGTHSWHQVLLN